MARRFLLLSLLALAVGCGGGSSGPTPDASIPDAFDQDGFAATGEVCGATAADLDAGALPCQPGLVCCYPCGAIGCLDRCAVPCTDTAGCSGGCPQLP